MLVHPRKLCEKIWEYAEQQQGSTLIRGKVVQAIIDETSNGNIIKGVLLEDGTCIEADILVVACGPWTQQAFQTWFPSNVISNLPTVTGIKCHSMLVKPPRIFSQAVFFESDGALGDGDLEVYPRPDGDCYVNGFAGDEVIVEEDPGEEVIERDAIDLLIHAMDVTSTELGGLEPHTEQVCYWPETEDGLPLIGNIPNIQGAYVATGHSVWGILQGPSTGKALAELLIRGSCTCLDLTPFDVARYN